MAETAPQNALHTFVRVRRLTETKLPNAKRNPLVRGDGAEKCRGDLPGLGDAQRE